MLKHGLFLSDQRLQAATGFLPIGGEAGLQGFQPVEGRVQGKPVIIARKLRYFADKEFDGLHRSPDAQPINPKSER